MNNNIIKGLNTFLKGNYMAIYAYDQYIKHLQDEELKEVFQQIQRNHKEHVSIVADRIENLGGTPADVGLLDNFAQLITAIKRTTKNNNSILKDALVGEHRGIKKSKELLDDELDCESLRIVHDILENNEKHVELLDDLLN